MGHNGNSQDVRMKVLGFYSPLMSSPEWIGVTGLFYL